MTTYTDVFGGDTIPPSQSGYVAIALTADTTFFWPEVASGADLMADIMEVTPDAAWSMTFPAANVVSTGRDVLVRNLGSDTITLKDSAGGTIGTVAAGVSKYLYITDNSTAAGSWTVFTFGTGTSAADAATLAGYGLVATGSTLSQQHSVVSSAVTRAVLASDRATVIMFTNSGTVDCDLPTVASVGNGFFVSVSNQGTGTVTIDGSGSETIDGETTKDLAPGESCTVVTNGVLWASIGYGRSTQFQFTKLVLDISTGSPFTLTSVQAQNKLIQTIGTITADVTINVPAVVAVYYIQCSHTGAFNTTFKTAAGAGVALDAGDRSILYCDGVDVVSAQTASAPAANLSGGAAGAVVYQSAVGVTSFASVGTSGQVFVSGGTGAPGWSDLGLITHAYSAKNPPVDADEFPLADSAAAQGPKKLTWANLKATLKTYFDGLYAALAGSASQVFSVAAATSAAHAVSAAGIQVQLVTAFTTGGTSTAYTLTPTPASIANATGQRFRVTFNAASGATPTLAVSGQTAKNLKYYDSAAAKQAITSTQVPINWISDVEYDGTDWVVLNPSGGSFNSSAVTGIGNGRATDITISSAGEVTMPLQPAFMAYNSATDADVTGDGTIYTIICDTEVFDQNADYNAGTGVFTAPVTGRYRFSASVVLQQLGAAHSTQDFGFVTSNRTYTCYYDVIGTNPFGTRGVSFSVLADMDSGDTANIYVNIAGSTKTVDVFGGASPYTQFCGELVA